MSDKIPMTVLGKKRIDEELENLIKVEREKIKTAISEARELGDLKENSEYHSAKEKQAIIEGRILELQNKLANAQVIDPSTLNAKNIVFGATVNLYDLQKDMNLTYQIVGVDEADIKNGKISYLGPLGKALIGREEGETIIVKAPKGDVEYEIEKFYYK